MKRKSILSLLRRSFGILRRYHYYTSGVSYYPDSAHKSSWQVFKDQMHFLWKYGFIEEFYFLYGFDRTSMHMDQMEKYLTPYRAFLNATDHLNYQNPYYDQFLGKMTCRVLNQDKFYFYLFLSRLGIPTPKILFFIRGKKLLFVDDSLGIDKTLPDEGKLKAILSMEGLDAFAKPSDGLLGRGAFSLSVRDSILRVDDQPADPDKVIEILTSADYIVQERIVQHPRMSALCPTCVNTIRLQTVMTRDGDVIPFGPGLRIGRVGSVVDNWAQGGLFVGIDASSSSLKGDGFLKPKYGTVAHQHPDTGLVFDGYEIPFYKEAEALAVRLHELMYRSHSIGWDIAITENGPVIIEGNDRWEVSLVQAVHGGLGYLAPYFDEEKLYGDVS